MNIQRSPERSADRFNVFAAMHAQLDAGERADPCAHGDELSGLGQLTNDESDERENDETALSLKSRPKRYY